MRYSSNLFRVTLFYLLQYLEHTRSLLIISGFSIFLLPCSNDSILQAQWVNQQSGTTENLYGSYFTDSLRGWICGGGGILLHTTDGGNHWLKQENGATNTLRAICFTDSNMGVVVGSSGFISRTTNGGITWEIMSSGTTNNLFSISIVDSHYCYIVGDGGKILQSSDGGITWINQVSGTSYPLFGVSFFDEKNGIVVGGERHYVGHDEIGHAVIFRTTDGGSTWLPQLAQIGFPLRGICFIDSTTAVVVGDWGAVYRTTNGGLNWTNQTNGTSADLFGVSFVNRDTGTIVGQYEILRTVDGCLSWSSQSNATKNILYSVSFIDSKIGTAVGNLGEIIHTNTGGLTLLGLGQNSNNSFTPNYFLAQNYPNPFNPQTTIEYNLPRRSFVSLNVYNLIGQCVTTIVSEERLSGSHKVVFDGSALSSGVYFYRISVSDFTETKKLILLK